MDADDVLRGIAVGDGAVKPFDFSLLARIDAYIEDLFAAPDAALRENRARANAAGLPPINVSATQGKLLYVLARMARARRVLEVGTLGGYSTTWLARALPAGGEVVTLEVEQKHADVAAANVAGVAPGVAIDIRVGDATRTLESMIASGEPPFDVVFIDADKPRYVDYLTLVMQLAHEGTVILADNVIRQGDVLDDATADVNARGARAYNAAVAAHPRLDATVLPIIRERIDGLSMAIVKA